MKTLKLKSIVSNLLGLLILSFFVISCDEDANNFHIENEDYSFTENGFRVKATFQKKLIITDDSGLNSIVLGISSDNKEAFDLHTEQAYILTSLSKSEFKEIESNKVEERIQVNSDYKIPNDSEAVHIEILSKRMDENTVALDVFVNTHSASNRKKAQGHSSSINWHYSWAAPHYFIFWRSGNGTFCRGAQYIANGGPSFPSSNEWNWKSFKCNDTYEIYTSSNNDRDTRALVYPQNGSSYHYLVK